MIDKMSDEKILDLLMTSDFSEDYKPEGLKFLLTKFRYFYRLLEGKNNTMRVDKEGKLRNLSEKISQCQDELRESKIKLAKNKDFLDQLQNKSLSLSERIKGKLDLTKN